MSFHQRETDAMSTNEEEKAHQTHVETLRQQQDNIEIDEELNASINRKFDLRILPWLFGIWFFAYIDKANIGIAKINGLPEDLGISQGDKFNIALLVFYVPYILVDIPSNWILKKMQAGIYLPTLIILWGVVTTFTGFIKTYTHLIVIRILLGISEGGLLGGIAVYLSMFYRRHESGWRIGVFYSAAPISSAFGGIFATGLGQIKLHGYNGWPWIFFIEGIVTVLFGLTCLFFMPNTPADTKFLTEEERIAAIARMKADAHGSTNTGDVREEKFNWHWVGLAFRAPQTYLASLIWVFMLIPLYSYVLFLPTIIKGLGYANIQTQLFIIPPSMAAFFTVLITAFYSDKLKARGPVMVAGCSLAIIGYVLLLTAKENSVRYGGTVFIPAGLYPASAMIMGWLSNNLAPHYVRATGIGALIAFANTAAFPASFIYLAKDAPHYTLGHTVCLGSSILCLLFILILTVYLSYENRQRESGARDHRLSNDNEGRLGHKHPAFKYTL